LVSFVASSGTGKTWWLMYSALRALFKGLNVVFISMEMAEVEMVERIQHYITGLPAERYAGKINIPVFNCIANQNGSCRKASKTQGRLCSKCVGTDDFVFGTDFKEVTKKGLTVHDALKKSKAIKSLIRGNSLKLVSFPSRSATMSDINSYLYNLEHYEDFVPDVVITDYADKVKSDNPHEQARHQIAKIWEGHKSLAQKQNCLVITASQSNTARTGKDIKQGDWSESIAKLELCDVAIALNSKEADKKKGIMRCFIAKQRHDAFDTGRQIAVLYDYRIGRTYLNSALMPPQEQKE